MSLFEKVLTTDEIIELEKLNIKKMNIENMLEKIKNSLSKNLKDIENVIVDALVDAYVKKFDSHLYDEVIKSICLCKKTIEFQTSYEKADDNCLFNIDFKNVLIKALKVSGKFF